MHRLKVLPHRLLGTSSVASLDKGGDLVVLSLDAPPVTSSPGPPIESGVEEFVYGQSESREEWVAAKTQDFAVPLPIQFVPARRRRGNMELPERLDRAWFMSCCCQACSERLDDLTDLDQIG